MADRSPVLVLTRPKCDALKFLEDCENLLGRRIASCISPIMEIVPESTNVDLDRYRTIIVTSRNAVRFAPASLSGRVVATVGAKTSEYASSLGARATCLGDTVDDFLKHLAALEGPSLHLRGVHTRGNLAQQAQKAGALVDELVVYDQVPRPLSNEALAVLMSGNAVVPVFSPRSAALVSENPCDPETLVVAISAGAAEAWRGQGQIMIADHPDARSMLSLVAASF